MRLLLIRDEHPANTPTLKERHAQWAPLIPAKVSARKTSREKELLAVQRILALGMALETNYRLIDRVWNAGEEELASIEAARLSRAPFLRSASEDAARRQLGQRTGEVRSQQLKALDATMAKLLPEVAAKHPHLRDSEDWEHAIVRLAKRRLSATLVAAAKKALGLMGDEDEKMISSLRRRYRAQISALFPPSAWRARRQNDRRRKRTDNPRTGK